MEVGIIVYSQTGNTLSVAQKAEIALKNAGHSVSIEKVEAVADASPKPNAPVQLKTAPDASPYDVLIFASPVHAFSLAPAMKSYLSQISDLSGKKVYCYVTQHLKKAWMGGNHALRQIAGACNSKGAKAQSCGIAHWSSNERDAQIDAIVGKLSAI